MPRFLSGWDDRCCCPEMRCCTPETVTASLSGFSGVEVGGWEMAKRVSDVPWTDPAEFPQCEIHNGKVLNSYLFIIPSAIIYEAGREGQCTDVNAFCRYLGIGVPTNFSSTSVVYDVAERVWPSVAFPPKLVTGPAACVSPPPEWSMDPNHYDGTFVASYYDDPAWTQTCIDVPKLCQKPTDDGYYFTPALGGFRCESDLDGGVYVCHRQTVGLRPELKAVIARTAAGARNPAREEARLLFEVACRRKWGYTPAACGYENIIHYQCSPVLDPQEPPPDGSWHCVDYRCGPRTEVSENPCELGFCNQPIGFVKPHLRAYHELGNNSANLRVVLEPAQYMSGTVQFGDDIMGAPSFDDKLRRPFSWRVAGIEIKNGGEGYEVGEFLYVYPDAAWQSLLGNSWLIVNLPYRDYPCRGGAINQWADKYGYEGDVLTLPNGAQETYQSQRARISSVDDDGAITGIEIVPWFRDPDFDGACIEKPLSSRTPYYPQYTRVLCHPISVDLGGKGYLRGDTITFVPANGSTEMLVQATAVVTDVDEDGAILDWHINGSDIHFYAGQYSAPGGPHCLPQADEPDERGAYKFDGKNLCSLAWIGVGVPRRGVSAGGPPGGHYGYQYWQVSNTGSLTSVNISITRSPCRTSIRVVVSDYPFSRPVIADALKPSQMHGGLNGTKQDQCYNLFPPFPKCTGGGAVVEPTIGADGGNESVIGGPLAGGVVVAPGAGYVFRDKAHAQPILSLSVPSITGQAGVGSGATIGSVDFSEVLNFPYPGYSEYEVSANRFAYYPVTGVTIATPGVGYEVGMEFDLLPVGGGRAVSDVWSDDGGDNPDVDTNGSYYGGNRAKYINSSGHYDYPLGSVKMPTARVRITAVDGGGGITGVEVIDGGMMFRPVWASSRVSPSVSVVVNSDTGEGAAVAPTFGMNHLLPTYGQLLAVSVVSSTQIDPAATPPAPYPGGGRNYANPASGTMWELNDITVGGKWSMISYANWEAMPVNSARPADSQHDIVEGAMPPYVPRAERCVLGECYHPLLSRTYQLIHYLYGPHHSDELNFVLPAVQHGDFQAQYRPEFGRIASNSFLPRPASNDLMPPGRPPYSYCLTRKKGTIEAAPPSYFPYYDADGNYIDEPLVYPGHPDYIPVALTHEWAYVLWGPTITLSHVLGGCPDHLDGRTG